MDQGALGTMMSNINQLININSDDHPIVVDALSIEQRQPSSHDLHSCIERLEIFNDLNDSKGRYSFSSLISQIIGLFKADHIQSQLEIIKSLFLFRPLFSSPIISISSSIDPSIYPSLKKLIDHPFSIILDCLICFYFKKAPRLLHKDLIKLFKVILLSKSEESKQSSFASLDPRENKDDICMILENRFKYHINQLIIQLAIWTRELIENQNLDNLINLPHMIQTVHLITSLNSNEWEEFIKPLEMISIGMETMEDQFSHPCLLFLTEFLQRVMDDKSNMENFNIMEDNVECILIALNSLFKHTKIQEQLNSEFLKLAIENGYDNILSFIQNQFDHRAFNIAFNYQKIDQTIDRIELNEKLPNRCNKSRDQLAMDLNFSALTHLIRRLIMLLADILFDQGWKIEIIYTAGMLESMIISITIRSISQNPFWIQNQISILLSSNHLLSKYSSSTMPNSIISDFILYENRSNQHLSNDSNGHSKSTKSWLKFSRNFIHQFPIPAQCAIRRGMLIASMNFSQAFILNSIANIDQSNYKISTSNLLTNPNSNGYSLLFHDMIPFFLNSFQVSNDEYTRCFSFSGLSTSIEFLNRYLNQRVNLSIDDRREESTLDDQVESSVRENIEDCIQSLLQFIWNNSNDLSQHIVTELCHLFPIVLKMIDLSHMGLKNHLNFGFSLATNLAKRLIQLEWAVKGKYALLLVLLQHLGPLSIFQIEPLIFKRIYNDMINPGVRRTAIPFFEALLDYFKENQVGKEKNRRRERGKEQMDTKVDCPSHHQSTLVTSTPNLLLDRIQVDFEYSFIRPLKDALLRYNQVIVITNHILPSILTKFPSYFNTILSSIFSDEDGKMISKINLKHIRALLCILKVARQQGIIDGKDLNEFGDIGKYFKSIHNPDFSSSTSNECKNTATDLSNLDDILEKLLKTFDDEIRLDALQLLCQTKKITQLPTSLELVGVMRYLDYNIQEQILFVQKAVCHHLDNFISRIHDAILHHYRLPARSLQQQKQIYTNLWPLIYFLHTISYQLIYNIYPPATSSRRIVALELIKTLVQQFGPSSAKGKRFSPYFDLLEQDPHLDIQYCSDPNIQAWKVFPIFNRDSTFSLLTSLWDQFDNARAITFQILSNMPAPFPGLENAQALKLFIRRVVSSLNSPRMRELDATALAIRLLVTKYIIQLGWAIEIRYKVDPETAIPIHVDIHVSSHSTSNDGQLSNQENDMIQNRTQSLDSSLEISSYNSVGLFLHNLIDLVEIHINATKIDRKSAAMHCPIHGPLMVLRHAIQGMDFSKIIFQTSFPYQPKGHLDKGDNESLKFKESNPRPINWHQFFHRLIKVSCLASEIALSLKYPIRYDLNPMIQNQSNLCSNNNMEKGTSKDPMRMISKSIKMKKNGIAHTNDHDQEDKDAIANCSESTEAIVVAMWLTLKEVSLLFGSISKILMGLYTIGENGKEKKNSLSTTKGNHDAITTHLSINQPGGDDHDGYREKYLPLLDLSYVYHMGNLLVSNLLLLRHRGAMETTAEGLEMIVKSLIESDHPDFDHMIEKWLNQLLERIETRPWRLLSTRRSAGLPYAFLAILKAGSRSRRNAHHQSKANEAIAESHGQKNSNSSKFDPSFLLPIVIERLISIAKMGLSGNDGNIGKNILSNHHHDDEKLKMTNDQDQFDADVGQFGEEQNHTPRHLRHQVHALNILRVIIRDKSIVADIEPYFESMLIVILQLICSPTWGVQNSATMAFSTLMERSAGGTRAINLDGQFSKEKTLNRYAANHLITMVSQQHQSSQNLNTSICSSNKKLTQLTIADFLKRYPKVYAFILQQFFGQPSIDPSPNAKGQLMFSYASSNSSYSLNSSSNGDDESMTCPIYKMLTNFSCKIIDIHAVEKYPLKNILIDPNNFNLDANIKEIKIDLKYCNPSKEQDTDKINLVDLKWMDKNQPQSNSGSCLYTSLLILSRLSPLIFTPFDKKENILTLIEQCTYTALSMSLARTSSQIPTMNKDGHQMNGHHQAMNHSLNHPIENLSNSSPLIIQSSNTMVRTLAAKALANLISTPMLPAYLDSLIETIPSSPDEFRNWDHPIMNKNINEPNNLVINYKKQFSSEQSTGRDYLEQSSNMHSPSSHANRLHGLLTICYYLLHIHIPILRNLTFEINSKDKQDTNHILSLHGKEGALNQHDKMEESSFTNPVDRHSSGKDNSPFYFLQTIYLHILPQLVKKLWIIRHNCSPIASSFLSIVHDFIILPYYDPTDDLLLANPASPLYSPQLQSLVAKTIKILSIQMNRYKTKSTYEKDPIMIHEKHKKSAQILILSILYQDSSLMLNLSCTSSKQELKFEALELALSKIGNLLQFPTYEVRLAVLKYLKKALGSTIVEPNFQRRLAYFLLSILGFLKDSPQDKDHVGFVESYPKAITLILKLMNKIGVYGQLGPILMDTRHQVIVSIWQKLIQWTSNQFDISNKIQQDLSKEENWKDQVLNNGRTVISSRKNHGDNVVVGSTLRWETLKFMGVFLESLTISNGTNMDMDHVEKIDFCLEMHRQWLMIVDLHAKLESAVDDRKAALKSLILHPLGFLKFQHVYATNSNSFGLCKQNNQDCHVYFNSRLGHLNIETLWAKFHEHARPLILDFWFLILRFWQDDDAEIRQLAMEEIKIESIGTTEIILNTSLLPRDEVDQSSINTNNIDMIDRPNDTVHHDDQLRCDSIGSNDVLGSKLHQCFDYLESNIQVDLHAKAYYLKYLLFMLSPPVSWINGHQSENDCHHRSSIFDPYLDSNRLNIPNLSNTGLKQNNSTICGIKIHSEQVNRAYDWKLKLAISTDLFEREKDNFFSEPILLSQMARLYILRLLEHDKQKTNSTEEQNQILEEALNRFKDEIKVKFIQVVNVLQKQFSSRYSKSSSTSPSLPSSAQDDSSLPSLLEWQCMQDHIFTPLYQLLLGLETITHPRFMVHLNEIKSIDFKNKIVIGYATGQLKDSNLNLKLVKRLQSLIQGKIGVIHPIIRELTELILNRQPLRNEGNGSDCNEIHSTFEKIDHMSSEITNLCTPFGMPLSFFNAVKKESNQQKDTYSIPNSLGEIRSIWHHVFASRRTATNFLLSAI